NPTRELWIEAYARQCLLRRLLGNDAIELGEELEVFDSRKFVVNQRRMGHVPNLGQRLAALSAKDLHAAMGGFAEAGDDAHEGGLASAIFSTQHIEAPGLELQRDIAKGGGASINFRDVLNLDGKSLSAQCDLSMVLNWAAWKKQSHLAAAHT